MRKPTRLITYGIVGISAFLGEFLSFLLLNQVLPGWSVRLAIAQIVSFCVGLTISFLGNRQYTFWSKAGYDRRIRGQLLTFGILAAINLVLTTIGLWFMVERLHF